MLRRLAGLRLHKMHRYSRWLYALQSQDKVDTFVAGTRWVVLGRCYVIKYNVTGVYVCMIHQ